MGNALKNIGFFFCFLSFSASAQFDCEVLSDEMNMPALETEIISIEYFSNIEKDRGEIVWKNGSIYSGKIKNETMHGAGMLTYSNDFKYDGDWKFGKKEGFGIIYFVNGIH